MTDGDSTVREHSRPTTFFTLDRREQLVVLQALVLTLAIRAALRAWGVQAVHGWLERRLPATRPDEAHPAAVTRLAALIESVNRRVAPDRTCLERSLVLWYLGRRRGLDLDVALGARKGAAGLEAHAWVECRGTVVNDAPDVPSRYTPVAWGALGRRG